MPRIQCPIDEEKEWNEKGDLLFQRGNAQQFIL